MTEAPAFGRWEPIETALRDGTIVLLAGGRFFCEAREHYVSTPTTAAWYGGFWLIVGTEGGYVCPGYDGPTHWMPLPPVPEVTHG